MTFLAFLNQLSGVQKTGDRATAFCPGHDDQVKRSLSIRAHEDKILIRCFTGCKPEAIVHAMGLTLADLFLDARPESLPRNSRRVVATYDYRDESGTLLYQAVRFEPKAFRPRRPDGQGGWIENLQETRRVLYRLPDLAESTRAYFVEGEKDVETLWAVGCPATTTQGGSESWTPHAASYAQQLQEVGLQDLVILPDHDTAGEKYAAAVARSAAEIGLRVKVVRLPDLAYKQDVSDWIQAGHTRADLERVVENIPWGTSPTPPSSLGAVHLSIVLDQWEAAIHAGATPLVRTPFPALNHFLTGGLAPGELVYLGARPGVGKTALALEVARGSAADGLGVLVVSREMVQVALARRLLAQSARVSASALKSGRIGDGEWVLIRSTLPKLKTLPLWLTDQTVSLDEITTIVEGFADTPPLRLLIIDYLQLVRAPDTVRERRLQVEYVSQGLKALALAQGFPILCLSSLSRTSAETKEKRPTLDRLRESGELEHDADIVLFLHREFDKAETEVIVAKNRDGRTGTAHLLFRPEYVAFDEPSERPDPDA